jgi:hypothetical protein
MDEDRFVQQCEKMLRDETEWRDNIKIVYPKLFVSKILILTPQIYVTAPRLLMLDKPQLSHFVMQLAKPSQPTHFAAYLWDCFPDYEISALQGSIAKRYSEGFNILMF